MFPDLFETSRLTLRPIGLDDSDAVFTEYAHDLAVLRFLLWRPHATVTETQTLIARWLETPLSRTYATIERDSGRLVGHFSLQLKAPHRVSFGYVLASSWWGKGFMTELVSEVVAWSLRQDGVWRVEAGCDVENLASARVMEKAGLVCEGILRRWLVHPNIGPEPRDCFSYALVQ